MIEVELPDGQIIDVETDDPQAAENAVLSMIKSGELNVGASQQPESSFTENLLGAGESALTLLSGATSGLVGGLGSTLQQAAREIFSGEFGSYSAAKRIQQASQQGAQNLTYQPQTKAGQQMLQTIDEISKPIQALPPVLPQGIVSGGIQRQLGVASDFGGNATRQTIDGASRLAKIPGEFIQRQKEDIFPPVRSVGADQVPLMNVRDNEAASLMRPIRLTEGEASRDPDLLREESQLKKSSNGALLRLDENEKMRGLEGNFEEMIDYVKSVYSEDKPQVGQNLVDFLTDDYAKAKRQTSWTYKLAEKKGALKEKVDMQPLATFLNENRAERLEFGVMDKVQEKLNVMEKSQGDYRKNDLALPALSLSEAEELIQYINRNVDKRDNRDKYMASMLKNVIDDQTKKVDNKWYKRARSWRVRQAENFENMEIITNLLATKNKTDDRKIAIEKVVDDLISPKTSNEGLEFLVAALNRGGERGKGVLADLRGAFLADIRNQSFNKNSTNEFGQAYMSAHKYRQKLQPLINSRKLDTLFDRKIVNNLKLLESVADYIATAPPGVINNSNTASALAIIADLGLASTGTLPVVLASKWAKQTIKDQQLKKRVLRALRQNQIKD